MLKLGIELDTVTLSTLINGLYIGRKIAKAVRLFDDMVQEGAYNTVINSLCKDKHLTEALKLFSEMKGEMDATRKLFNSITNKGYVPDEFTYNIIINGYCKAKRIDEAMELFHEMTRNRLTPDVVTYSTLISGMSQVGRLAVA
ncbi:pentatricopeptide repeat-containing protein At1g62680, mitochondrial-like [Durio zibethinus]|uniref:Pentatricopeptide repeat-containing protein At1g62680, mitochondrial-like n=1 Tax=Durio zibethinus TaxID=66656 RepID=A0A6P5Z5D8_DURZI|nr:pentatricopeptide repeat-containing protein At1g62680, mitochondrial-like [Durio zibethinus]